jgi:MoaA/NifB/PqqE/SkfB family radical SAM enzyme
MITNSKSVFLNAAEEAREKLGPALCLAKWKQVSLHLQTGKTNSCYHPPLHQISADLLASNPSALHNTPYKKEQRKIMLKQERPSECSYCWTQEDLGNLSDRHYRSGEPWAAKDFDIIVNSTGDEDAIPSYVEVNFNNACNLRCSYCSPQFSSSWADEVNRLGGYPTSPAHNSPDHFAHTDRRAIPAREDNPYVDAFWEWWPTLYPELEHFRMTGGEPLMDKNTYRVFDYVLANPSPKLHLDVTSNFSVEPALFEKYLDYVKKLTTNEDKKIEHFMQYVSLDSTFFKAEYIRDGLNFDRLWNNVNRFLNEVPNRSSLTFIITMNNLNITSIQELLLLIRGLREVYSKTYQRVWFDVPILRSPEWQSIQLLPESYVEKLEEMWACAIHNSESRFPNPLHGFKDYEVQKIQRVIDYMREGQKLDPAYVNKQKANFYKFFSEHDKRRGTGFIRTFPEMYDFWKGCEYHAKHS